MVVTHHIAHDLGALAMFGVRGQPPLPHRVEDAALHRLQAVPHIGQRAAGDDRERVVQISRARELMQRDVFGLAWPLGLPVVRTRSALSPFSPRFARCQVLRISAESQRGLTLFWLLSQLFGLHWEGHWANRGEPQGGLALSLQPPRSGHRRAAKKRVTAEPRTLVNRRALG